MVIFRFFPVSKSEYAHGATEFYFFLDQATRVKKQQSPWVLDKATPLRGVARGVVRTGRHLLSRLQHNHPDTPTSREVDIARLPVQMLWLAAGSVATEVRSIQGLVRARCASGQHKVMREVLAASKVDALVPRGCGVNATTTRNKAAENSLGTPPLSAASLE